MKMWFVHIAPRNVYVVSVALDNSCAKRQVFGSRHSIAEGLSDYWSHTPVLGHISAPPLR